MDGVERHERTALMEKGVNFWCTMMKPVKGSWVVKRREEVETGSMERSWEYMKLLTSTSRLSTTLDAKSLGSSIFSGRLARSRVWRTEKLESGIEKKKSGEGTESTELGWRRRNPPSI
ncbi:hypothetical protein ACLOJK_027579 [Asimina triloba]